MWPRRFLICLLLSLCALSALATPRVFPPNVQRGTLAAGSAYPQVLINGQAMSLSPGAKIRSKQNRIIMPSSLMNNVYLINYTVDNLGQIDQVWILTNEELALSPQ